ncbi:MAG: hypothetical protein R2832_03555 [Rhodothermales bacterium]
MKKNQLISTEKADGKKTAEQRKPFKKPEIRKHEDLPVITAGSIFIR